MQIVIKLKVKEGREDDVPHRLTRNAVRILEAAFCDLIDDGLFDIEADVWTGAAH